MQAPPAEALPLWCCGSCRETNASVKVLLAQWAGHQHGGDNQTLTSLPTQKCTTSTLNAKSEKQNVNILGGEIFGKDQ